MEDFPQTRRKRVNILFLLLILGGAFALRLTCLLTYKTLPGWDPSSHISKALTTISEGHLTTSFFWYPPGFHFLLAIMFILTDLTTISSTSFLLIKVFIAIISAFQVVAVYLVAKRVYSSTVVGLLGALFMSVSLRHIEMLGWGGYPNITGMLLMGLALYLFLHRHQERIGTTISLLTMISGLVLTHSISTFVFVGVVLSHLFLFSLISKKPPKRELLMVVASLLLVFCFYLTFAGEHIWFILRLIAGYSPHISTTNPYVETFGEIPTYLTPIGVLTSLLFLWEKRDREREILLLISWLLVPFILFQTNFIARFANRFSYFMVYPMAFLPAFALRFTTEKLYSRIQDERLGPISGSTKRTIAITLCLILSAGGTIYLVSDVPTRIFHYAGYYLVCAPRDYDTSVFAQVRTTPRSNILAAYPADPWISILTGRDTSSADVESTNFFMGNSLIGIEETGPYNMGRNPSLYLDIGEDSYEALRLKNKDLRIEFVTPDSERHSMDLSEVQYERVEWFERSAENIGLRYLFESRFYTLEKSVTIRSRSPLIEFRYRIIPNVPLSNLNITCGMVLNRELKYYSLFIPEFLPWLNPWDKPTVRDSKGRFAYVSFPFNEISDRFFALFDEDKNALIAVRLGTDPQELTIGARSDRRIDTVKATYRYDSVRRGERINFAFDVLGTSLPQDSVLDDIHREFILSLIQEEMWAYLESQDYIGVVESTPATHIQGRQNRLPTGYLLDPHFNRIFDNGLSNLYAFHRT
jgi:hypothetical protein